PQITNMTSEVAQNSNCPDSMPEIGRSPTAKTSAAPKTATMIRSRYVTRRLLAARNSRATIGSASPQRKRSGSTIANVPREMKIKPQPNQRVRQHAEQRQERPDIEM